MSLLYIIGVLILIGLGLYLLGTLEIDGTIKKIIHAVVIVFVVLWLLQNLGALPDLRLR